MTQQPHSLEQHETLDVGIETPWEQYVRENAHRHHADTQLRELIEQSYSVIAAVHEPVAFLTESEAFEHASGMTHVVAAAHAAKLANRAQAALLRHAVLARESESFMFDDPTGGLDTTAEHLARALGISTYMADKMLSTATMVFHRLPRIADLLAVGEVSFDKASLVAERLADAPIHVTRAVEAAVAPTLAEKPAAQVRKDIERLLIELAPDDADAAHAAAAARRRVSRPQARAHGMSRIRMDIPADQGSALDVALDTAARAALRAGDCRTYQQLRADALAQWAAEALEQGWEISSTCGDPVAIPPAKITVTVPLEVLARIMPDWHAHPSPAQVLADAYDRDPEAIDRREDDIAALLGAGPKAPSEPAMGRTEATWVEGYGPLSPALGILLSAGGTWQRIVTDGPSGAPLDIGRQRYRPPAAIETAVRLRDRTCQGPGCTSNAHGELDHIVEWHDGGGTSVGNLLLLCSRCHRRKSIAGEYLIAVRPDGSRIWQTPGGRYTTYPQRSERRIVHAELPLGLEDAA